MKLKSMSLRNYRSIAAEVTLDDLGDLEVLHGPNNSGKSNVLRGIALLLEVLGHSKLVAALQAPDVTDWMALRRHRFAAADEPTELCWRTDTFELSLQLRDDRVSITRLVVDDVELVLPLGRDQAIDTVHQLRHGLSIAYIPAGRLNSREQSTWNHHLIELKESRVKAERARWSRFAASLASFSDILGPGTIDVVREAQQRDLAWITPDGDVLPISEEGSGVRNLIPILGAVFGSGSDVVLLEEPETNLSMTLQTSMLRQLEKAARKLGVQILMTSHTYAFDGRQHFWQVTKEERATSVVRKSRADDRGSRLGLNAKLADAWSASGRSDAAWVSAEGILRLPGAQTAHLGLGDGGDVMLGNEKDGTVVLYPLSVVTDWLTTGTEE